MTYPIGDMPLVLLQRIAAQLPSSTTIVPFFRGESTLHPQFASLLGGLKKFSKVQLATNADNLTKSVKNAILENVTFLSISLHEYKMPKDCNFLGLLYDFVGETQVSILDSLVEGTRRCKFITEWRKHTDRVRIYETHSERGFGSMGNSKPYSACHKPFEDMVVYWDGRVGLCNHDWNNLFPLGDLNDESVAEVWNGMAYDYVRKLHQVSARRDVPTCRDCSFESNKVYGELIKNGRQVKNSLAVEKRNL